MDAVCAEYQAAKGVRVEVAEERAPEPVEEPILNVLPALEVAATPPAGSLVEAFAAAMKPEPPALLPLFEQAAWPVQKPPQKRAARRSDRAQLAFQF